jgi:3',5'-cyclic AMP phosphodiesterase CpdA
MQRRNFLKNIGLSSVGAMLPSLMNAAPMVNPNKVVTLAHITDVHMMPLIGAAKGFEHCLAHIQNNMKADFMLNTGDCIMEGHKTANFLTQKQWSLFNKVLKNENSVPLLSCIGNHDICCEGDSSYNFSDGKKWTQDELGLQNRYYSVETPYWKIIMLDSVQPKANGEWYTAFIDDAQFEWLENELKSTTKFVLIASHIPILAACVFFDGNRNAKNNWEIPSSWMHTDTVKLNTLFSKYPNVNLAVSGHIHLTDKVEYNDVTYCCNGAVSGRWWKGKNKNTQAGYAKIELFDNGTFKNTYVHYA